MEANSSGAAHYLRRTCPPVLRGPPLCTVAQGKAKRGGGGGVKLRSVRVAGSVKIE